MIKSFTPGTIVYFKPNNIFGRIIKYEREGFYHVTPIHEYDDRIAHENDLILAQDNGMVLLAMQQALTEIEYCHDKMGNDRKVTRKVIIDALRYAIKMQEDINKVNEIK